MTGYFAIPLASLRARDNWGTPDWLNPRSTLEAHFVSVEIRSALYTDDINYVTYWRFSTVQFCIKWDMYCWKKRDKYYIFKGWSAFVKYNAYTRKTVKYTSYTDTFAPFCFHSFRSILIGWNKDFFKVFFLLPQTCRREFKSRRDCMVVLRDENTWNEKKNVFGTLICILDCWKAKHIYTLESERFQSQEFILNK